MYKHALLDLSHINATCTLISMRSYQVYLNNADFAIRLSIKIKYRAETVHGLTFCHYASTQKIPCTYSQEKVPQTQTWGSWKVFGRCLKSIWMKGKEKPSSQKLIWRGSSAHSGNPPPLPLAAESLNWYVSDKIPSLRSNLHIIFGRRRRHFQSYACVPVAFWTIGTDSLHLCPLAPPPHKYHCRPLLKQWCSQPESRL